VALWAVFPMPPSHAQLSARTSRCVDGKGHVTYTDLGCPSATRSDREVVLHDNALDTAALREAASRLEQDERRRAATALARAKTMPGAGTFNGRFAGQDCARARRDYELAVSSVSSTLTHMDRAASRATRACGDAPELADAHERARATEKSSRRLASKR